MRIVFASSLVTLLFVATGIRAANVAYEDPYLTIVASEEPLQSVLKSLGEEMRISVTTPTGFNPVVSCAIEKQPVKQALKTLLGEFSYSLKWDEDSGALVGLTILGSGTGSAAAPERQSPPVGVTDADSSTVNSSRGQGSRVPIEQGAPMQESVSAIDAERAEREAQMAEEREAHQAEMAQRRQEEDIAQETRMKEEVQRNNDELRAYIESQGLTMPQ